MYHGIIQEANWTPRGSYLRAQDRAVPARQGDRATAASGGCASTASRRAGHRRHVRRSDAGRQRIALDSTQPRMLDETPAQLVRAPRRTRTAGGATRRSGCSCCGRTSPSCPALQTLAAHVEQPDGARSTRCGRSKAGRARRRARARADEGRQPAHARAGHPRQRDALQGGRQVVRRRLSRRRQGHRPRRRHPGAAHAEPAQGARRAGDRSRRRWRRTRREGVQEIGKCLLHAGAADGRRRRRSPASRRAAAAD